MSFDTSNARLECQNQDPFETGPNNKEAEARSFHVQSLPGLEAEYKFCLRKLS